MRYTTAMMHKKLVIIIAIFVGVLIVASGVIGAMVVLNRNNAASNSPMTATTDTDPSKQEDQTTPDLSVDLGACTVVSYSTISEALALYIPEVRDANNRGFGYEGNGDRSQSCVYAFSSKDNQSNRLTVTVTEFSNEANKSNTILDHKDNVSVAGIGESAYFATSTDAVANQTSYSLFVIKDMKLYTFVILQNEDTDKFTAASAKEALVTLGQAI
jgi:hypothetical protein